MPILTATYTKGFARIVVRFFGAGAEVSSMGDVTEAEEIAAAQAEGADVAGWTCVLS